MNNKELQLTDKELLGLNVLANTDGESDVIVPAQEVRNVRLSNLVTVFNTIEQDPGITRGEIADITQLSLMTVGKIIDAFTRKGIILQRKPDFQTKVGRKASMLLIDYSNSYVIIDLSSYEFGFSINNVKRECIVEYSHKYEPSVSFTENLKAFLGKCKNILNAYSLTNRAIALGVSLPGPYDAETDRVTNKRMPELNTIAIAKMLEFGIGLPVSFIDENVKLSMYAHMQAIPDHETKKLVYLHIGDGVGGGVVLNGKIIRGNNQYAGDMGQLIFDPKGRTFEKIIKEPEDSADILKALEMFFYNSMWFYDPDAFIIEYDKAKNPQITDDLFKMINFERIMGTKVGTQPELIITDDIKHSHIGLSDYICDQWFKRALALPDKPGANYR